MSILWIARPGTNDVEINAQTNDPPPALPTYPNVYGRWNPYYPVIPEPQPWQFWQYQTTNTLNGFASGHNVDRDVAQGGLEYVKDFLVPALWVTSNDGQWTALANWNSGQTPVMPFQHAGQPIIQGTATPPTPRVPGANDTVILDRPGASITVTLASGAQNIRKLYLRETLNITGGSLTINYVPSPGSTPISAQFSGPVTLSGSAGLSVHTLQVDAMRTFTLGGGTLAFNTINLMPDSTTPAKIAISGDVTFYAVGGASATITNGNGSGSSGWIDLGGATRAFSVANGVGLFVVVPITNGGLTKAGSGTMHLDTANNYSGGTTINAGTLEVGVFGSIPGNVTNSAGTLTLDNASALASGATLALANSPGAGAVHLNFSGTQTISALYFGTTQQPAGTWGASGANHTNAAFTGSGILYVTTGPGSSNTSVSRTSGSSPSAYGDSVTFTATVTGSSPSGTVQFKADGVAVGSPVALVAGSASMALSNLTVPGSPHQITAFYSGDAANFPSDSSASPIPLSITPKVVTVTLTGTAAKTYNGTTDATLTSGNYSLPGVVSGDTVSLNNPSSGTYDTRNVGTDKTINVTGLAISGSSSASYALSSTSASGAIGAIVKSNLRVTAVPNTKTYDGATSAAATPTLAGSIQTGDSTPIWTESYDTKHMGTGKTLIPAGTMIDGNGGANYNVTFVNSLNGVISQTNLTLTAVPNTKTYDGTTSAAATPTVSAGSIQTGDSAAWTESYDTKNVGGSKTLTPARDSERRQLWRQLQRDFCQ